MKLLLTLLLILNLVEARTFEQAFNVQVITPTQKHLGESRSYYGTARFDERRIRDIVLRYDAYVQHLDADATYDHISRGERLFDLYSPRLYDLQKELQSTLGHKALEQNVIERLRLLEVDEKTIDTMRSTSLQTIPFYSLFDGVIIEKNIVEGTFAKNGQRLLRIVDNSLMWVEARVYQKDLSFIRDAKAATVRFEGLSGTYKATIDRIYPETDAKEQTARVRLIVSNQKGQIAQNMFATVDFLQGQKSMLMLPKEALIRREGKFYVFIQTDRGRYEPREVSARERRDGYEILDGVTGQEHVAANALFLLDSDAVTNGDYLGDAW